MPAYWPRPPGLFSQRGKRPDVWSARRAVCFIVLTSAAVWIMILAAVWLLFRG